MSGEYIEHVVGAPIVRVNPVRLRFEGHINSSGEIHLFPRPDYELERQKIEDGSKLTSFSFPMEVSMSSR